MRLVPGGGGHDEPDDGWVSGPALADTEHLTITLCTFGGAPLQPNGRCGLRERKLHPDVECGDVYVRASHLSSLNYLDAAELLRDPPARLTRPFGWRR